jgi:hypothetical protein
MVREAPYRIEPLDRHQNRAVFSCGKEVLDRYLKQQAGQDARRRVAAPFVLVEADSTNICGYYTLSAFSIELTELPSDIARQLPRYPVVPATLLGRLAVDSLLHGLKLGAFLLMDALQRAYQQADHIASAAVVVDAIDDEARRFYLHFDFLTFPEHQDRLFLPMRTIAELFR